MTWVDGDGVTLVVQPEHDGATKVLVPLQPLSQPPLVQQPVPQLPQPLEQLPQGLAQQPLEQPLQGLAQQLPHTGLQLL